MHIKKSILFISLLLFNQTLFAVLPCPVCTTICNTGGLKNGQQCVQLAGKQLYIRKEGAGNPTVIFSSGTGIPADTWFSSGIAAEVAHKTTVLAYDRPYTFNSCPNNNDFMPMTADKVALDLHDLLVLLKLPPPYILVGHSMGGLYTHSFQTGAPGPSSFGSQWASSAPA